MWSKSIKCGQNRYNVAKINTIWPKSIQCGQNRHNVAKIDIRPKVEQEMVDGNWKPGCEEASIRFRRRYPWGSVFRLRVWRILTEKIQMSSAPGMIFGDIKGWSYKPFLVGQHRMTRCPSLFAFGWLGPEFMSTRKEIKTSFSENGAVLDQERGRERREANLWWIKVKDRIFQFGNFHWKKNLILDKNWPILTIFN